MGLRQWVGAYVPMLVLARRNVTRASARSILAVVAVVIGVVAIGAIGAGGEAFKQDQTAAYEGFGGTATVSPVFRPEESDSMSFSDTEITRLRRAAGSATVLPTVSSFSAQVRTQDGEVIPTAQVRSIESPGQFYTAGEGTIPTTWRRSVIVGSRLANNNDIAVGDRIEVRIPGQLDRSFRVVAVLQPQGFADPLSADRSVFVPVTQFDDPAYDQALVRVDPQVTSIDQTADRIESTLNARERIVTVSPVREQQEQFEQLFGTVNQFLVGIGAISLLVAAVTVTNTMLMTVIERRGEIGVLRAVGYPRGAVLRLLIAEAALLGLIGAALGIPLAVAVGMILNELLLGSPLAFTSAAIRYILFGAGIGVITAVVAGVYPAWKAARERPVEALG